MTTCRVKVTFVPSINATFDAIDDSGDFVGHILDITGDTDYDFTIPMMSGSQWLQVYPVNGAASALLASPTLASGTILGYVFVNVINPVVVADTSATSIVSWELWQCCANDMQFAAPCDPTNYYLLSGTLAEAHSPVAYEDLRNGAPGILEGVRVRRLENVTMGEQVDSVRTLLHRYCNTAPVSSGLTVMNVPRFLFSGQFAWFVRMYLGYRGSMVLRVFSAAPAATDLVEYVDRVQNPSLTSYSLSGGSGLMMRGDVTTNCLTFHVPFYSNYRYLPAPPPVGAQVTAGINDFGQTALPAVALQLAGSGQVWQAAGDDFSLCWEYPPPSIICSPTALTRTQRTVRVNVILKRASTAVRDPYPPGPMRTNPHPLSDFDTMSDAPPPLV